MRRRPSHVLAAAAGALLLTAASQAEFLGIQVELDLFTLDGTTPLAELPGYSGQRVFNVYAAFDDPGDGCTLVFGSPDDPFQVATAGGSGFVNAVVENDLPPTPSMVVAFPSLNWDSFYTIGLKLTSLYNQILVGPGTPGPNTDPWPQDPASGMNMAWLVFCGRCSSGCGLHPQACAGSYPDLRVLLMRLVVQPGETLSGAFGLGVRSDGDLLAIAVSFVADCQSAGPDCNANGIADGCDFESGFSEDVNSNAIPDDCECPADVAEPPDGVVHLKDLMAVILSWGQAGGSADVNADGTVDVQDLVHIILAWGPCPHFPLPDCDSDGTPDDQENIFAPFVLYDAGYYPTSIAAGDLDGDNDPDLAVANTTGDDVSVLINDGAAHFTHAGLLDVADGPSSVVLGDLDADGDLDLAVAAIGADSVVVLLNQGGATFDAPVQYPAGDGPQATVLADVDGDGDLDLAVATGSHDVHVLPNNGDGTFGGASVYPVGVGPKSVAAGDLNGDGAVDFAVAQTTGVSVLLNSGGGTFATAMAYAAGTNPLSIAIADLDGDADADIAVANQESYDLSVLLNEGNGTFGIAKSYLAGLGPHGVALADLNADGYPDALVAHGTSLAVLLNEGGATFAWSSSDATTCCGGSLVLEDLDGDGDPDAAVVSSNGVSILLNVLGCGAPPD